MHRFNSPTTTMYSFLKKSYLMLWCVQRVFPLMLLLGANLVALSQPNVPTDGYVVFRYDNGQISSEGTMENGKPNGFWKTYFEDGTLKTSGNRVAFVLAGEWLFYRSDSTLQQKISYENGLRQGITYNYNGDGELLEELTFLADTLQGEARYFYTTGELYRTVLFERGKEQGKGYEFGRDGRIITLMSYSNGYLKSIEKVNRNTSAGKRTGRWMILNERGKLIESGNWTNGVRNGIFKFFDRKGDLDRIEVYRGGILVEDAVEAMMPEIRKEYNADGSLRSIGAYRDGSKQGVFREYDAEGQVVAGTLYENNIKVGEGIVDPEGRRQGDWVLYYPTGEIRAKGSYVDGLKDGPWTYFFLDGKTEQTGAYIADDFTGQWTWFFEDGSTKREEGYRRGKEDGLMVEYDRKGNIIHQGEYAGGYKEGLWVYTVNDHTEEGVYVDGEKHGIWVYTYNNGQLNFKGEFSGGIAIDKHEWYYPNGQEKLSGKYKSGERHGNWTYTRENGEVQMVIKYKFGEEIKIDGVKTRIPSLAPTDEQNP